MTLSYKVEDERAVTVGLADLEGFSIGKNKSCTVGQLGCKITLAPGVKNFPMPLMLFLKCIGQTTNQQVDQMSKTFYSVYRREYTTILRRYNARQGAGI